MEKLSEKDIRALKFGGICVVAILLFFFGTKWFGHWSEVRKEIGRRKTELKAIDLSESKQSKQASVISIVPEFDMPLKEEEQKNRFRKKFTEQLKGIKHEPLKILSTGKTLQKSYKLLLVQCSAKCKFTQVLDLLARLNENPYLVGIEEFKIKCDKSKPQEVQLDLTVSTAVLEVSEPLRR